MRFDNNIDFFGTTYCNLKVIFMKVSNHSPPQEAQSTTMSLPHLPPELQGLIITNLHPSAAIALRQTNHHYHSTVSLHRLAPGIVRKFLEDLDGRVRSQVDGAVYCRSIWYACYKCLCMKPGTLFEYFEVSCGGRRDRQCLGCDLKQGRVITGGTHFTLLVSHMQWT